MMNMVPNKGIRNYEQLFFNEHFDFLAPLEILQSNSLCDFMLYDTNFIKKQLEAKNNEGELKLFNWLHNNNINEKIKSLKYNSWAISERI